MVSASANEENLALRSGQGWNTSRRDVPANAQFATLEGTLEMGVARRGMPQESTDHQYEPQAQASFSRGGIPLRTVSGVGVLDPPLPPRKQPGSLTPIAASLLQRVLALIILIGVAVIAALLFAQR